MSRFVTLIMVSASIGVAAGDTGSQQRATPNAAESRAPDAIDDGTRAAVLAARDAIWRAWFADDTAALRGLLPASTTAGEGNSWESRDEIVAGSLRSATSGRRLVGLRFDDTRLHRNGNVVVVFSNYTLELEHDGRRSTVTGSASEVFVRTGGVWRNPFWYLGPR
jgi:ketosteroid isomerase-like protein